MNLARTPALVLGANGFLGSNLVIALVARGARVRAAMRARPENPDCELSSALERSEVVPFDLLDAASLERIVPDEGVVFLTAGLSGAVGSLARASADLEANGRGVLNLLEALRARRARARVVFPSSQLVYGRAGVLDESATPEPRSVYAIHKLLGEAYGAAYARAHGTDWVTLRIANPYGPRQRPTDSYGLVRWFIERAVRGEDLSVYGEGSQRRGYLYVDDVVAAFIAAAERGHGTYNVSHPEPCSVRVMAETVVRVVGRGRVVSVPWPDEARAVESGDQQLSIARACAELGWEPRVSLAEGIARTVASP